jgi:hypothetical protein
MIPVDVTTRPNEVVANIHDRMPVILRQVDEDLWLDREQFDPDLLQSLLVSFAPGQMRAYPVPTIVGSPTNDTPECMEGLLGSSHNLLSFVKGWYGIHDDTPFTCLFWQTSFSSSHSPFLMNETRDPLPLP